MSNEQTNEDRILAILDMLGEPAKNLDNLKTVLQENPKIVIFATFKKVLDTSRDNKTEQTKGIILNRKGSRQMVNTKQVEKLIADKHILEEEQNFHINEILESFNTELYNRNIITEIVLDNTGLGDPITKIFSLKFFDNINRKGNIVRNLVIGCEIEKDNYVTEHSCYIDIKFNDNCPIELILALLTLIKAKESETIKTTIST